MMQQTIAGYRDRAEAGAVLTEHLMKYAGQNVAVFGVGPGGVAVASPSRWVPTLMCWPSGS